MKCSLRLFMTAALLAIFMFITNGAANSELVENHLFAPNTPSLGIYHQEFHRTSINKDPDLTEGYNSLTEFKFSKAIKSLNKAAHNDSLDKVTRAEAYTYLGYTYMNIRDTKHCLEALKKSISLNPNNPLAYYFLAHEYFLNGDFSATEEYLKKAIEIHPKFVSAMRMLAELYKDQGELAKSAEYYQKIIEIFPNSGYFHYQYYKIQNQLKNYDEAETSLKTLIKLQPKYRPNYLNLGEIYISEGKKDRNKLDKALQEFDYILKITPDESRAFEGKAKVYFEKGDYDTAMVLAKHANDLSPGNAFVKALIADIRAAKDKELKKNLSWAAVCIGFLLAGIALAYFIISNYRKKYVISVIHNFNHSVDDIYDLETLVNYLLNFFLDLGGSPKGVFLLFNRQNNELSLEDFRAIDEEKLTSFNIFAGGDMTNWITTLKRYILTVDEVSKDPKFEVVFPSLKDRLKSLGLKYIIPIRDKNSLLGIVALDEFQARGKVLPYENDLLMPLVTTSAQSLSALTLYQISMSDETTGVYNKRYFMQNLNLELRRAERYEQPLSVIVLDLDDLKRVNTTYGYEQGDLLLRETGAIIRQNVREGIDIAARTGGEEFSIILPSTDADRVLTTAERIRRSVQECRFPGFPEGSKEKVTISLGTATYPAATNSEKSLVERAQAALTLAKRSGKNKICTAEKTEEPGKVVETGIISESGETQTAASSQARTAVQMVDSLMDETGFFSRSFFDERYSGEVRRAERSSNPCSLILMKPDLELSESERSGVFKEVSRIFKANLRRGIDVPARYDRDTLAILIPEADQHKTSQIARRIKALIDKQDLKAGQQKVTFSFGISNFPNVGRTEESFLDTARQALRMCQQMGGDRALIATPV
ncbi:MAG: diguanylate cyclase [Firmicutes bacterium]|nr:diguanylate cyclase [Bacillota bacterium]